MSQQIPAPAAPAPAPMPRKGNALALTGMILGVVALLLCLIPLVNGFAAFLGVLALVFGIVGLVKARDGRPGRGMAVAAIILAVLAGIGFAVSTAFTVAAVDAMDTAVDELDADLDRIDGSATDDLLATDVSVELGAFEAESDEFGLVESALPVTVTNTADEAFSYTIQIEAVDADGNRLADDYVYADELAPGQKKDEKVFLFVEDDQVEAMQAATFQIVEVSQM